MDRTHVAAGTSTVGLYKCVSYFRDREMVTFLLIVLSLYGIRFLIILFHRLLLGASSTKLNC